MHTSVACLRPRKNIFAGSVSHGENKLPADDALNYAARTFFFAAVSLQRRRSEKFRAYARSSSLPQATRASQF